MASSRSTSPSCAGSPTDGRTGFTSLAKTLHLSTSLAVVLTVRWVVVIALAVVGRFRHLVVFLATFVISDWLVARVLYRATAPSRRCRC